VEEKDAITGNITGKIIIKATMISMIKIAVMMLKVVVMTSMTWKH
jgi:hypothetical protein